MSNRPLLTFVTISALSLGSIACADLESDDSLVANAGAGNSHDETDSPDTRSLLREATLELSTTTGKKRKLTLRTYECTSRAQTLYCPVHEDEVVVSGSAWIAAGERGTTAFLTETSPGPDLESWAGAYGTSSDGTNVRLGVNAIGMSIEGMSRAKLRSVIDIFATTSGHGEAQAYVLPVPEGYVRIGMGGQTNRYSSTMAIEAIEPQANGQVAGRARTAVPGALGAFELIAIGIRARPDDELVGLHESFAGGSSETHLKLGTVGVSFDRTRAISALGGKAEYDDGRRVWLGAQASESGARSDSWGETAEGKTFVWEIELHDGLEPQP